METMTVALHITDFLRSVTGDESIVPSTDLLERGVVDSLTMMDLVSFVEDRYGFPIAVDELTPANFQSATALANLIEQRTSFNSVRDVA